MPPSAKKNYISDPEKKLNIQLPGWFFYSSMKGWVYLPCLFCEGPLKPADEESLRLQRDQLPRPLRMADNWPGTYEPMYKTMAMPFCRPCSARVGIRLNGNPLRYDRKGQTYGLYPL